MKVKQYAQVLVRSLEGVSENETRKRVARFKKLLKKRGDLKLLGGIVREFEKAWQAREGKLSLLLSARELPKETTASIKETLKRQGYRVREQVNNELVGGTAVLLENSLLVDNTVKGRLKKIQRLFS